MPRLRGKVKYRPAKVPDLRNSLTVGWVEGAALVLGKDPKAYAVETWTDDGYLTLGYVCGSTKYGKRGWFAMARDGQTLLFSGLGTREKASDRLVRLAFVMGLLED